MASSMRSSVARPLFEASSARREAVSGFRCTSMLVSLRMEGGSVKAFAFGRVADDARKFAAFFRPSRAEAFGYLELEPLATSPVNATRQKAKCQLLSAGSVYFGLAIVISRGTSPALNGEPGTGVNDPVLRSSIKPSIKLPFVSTE